MRKADLAFASHLASQPQSQHRSVVLLPHPKDTSHVLSQLRDLTVALEQSDAPRVRSPLEVSEGPDWSRHQETWSRTWYLDRFPGTDLAIGWPLGLVPAGLNVSIAWHVSPLPSAWVIGYLQRQSTSMRAGMMHTNERGLSDPILEGALPTALDLQRRLASNQERAFHVSFYLSVEVASRDDLEGASSKILAAAQTPYVRFSLANSAWPTDGSPPNPSVWIGCGANEFWTVPRWQPFSRGSMPKLLASTVVVYEGRTSETTAAIESSFGVITQPKEKDNDGQFQYDGGRRGA
jgi:hypothetical protein